MPSALPRPAQIASIDGRPFHLRQATKANTNEITEVQLVLLDYARAESGPIFRLTLLPLIQMSTSELMIFTDGRSGGSARQAKTAGPRGTFPSPARRRPVPGPPPVARRHH